MLPLPLVDSHAPPVRVMALHALAYCQRLFYLEDVEEIRVADASVFAGRELHAGLEADEEGEAVSIELTSEPLGLTGKVDCLKRRDGSYVPYEHKRGKPARAAPSLPPLSPEGRGGKVSPRPSGERGRVKTGAARLATLPAAIGGPAPRLAPRR